MLDANTIGLPTRILPTQGTSGHSKSSDSFKSGGPRAPHTWGHVDEDKKMVPPEGEGIRTRAHQREQPRGHWGWLGGPGPGAPGGKAVPQVTAILFAWHSGPPQEHWAGLARLTALCNCPL